MTATLPLARSRVAPVGPSQEAGGDMQLVTCFVAGEEYGLEICRVREIMRVGRITELPKAPPYVRGVINLRGRIVPILDLRRRLGLPDVEATSGARIVVVESGVKLLGLLVDGVSQVLRLPAETVEAPPEETDGGRAFVKALGKREKGVVLVLDLDCALRRDFEHEAPSASEHERREA